MSVEYPIFAFEKDDRSMRLIESQERIFYYLEAIDIENEEYVFWDARGEGVHIAVSVGAFRSKLESISSGSEAIPFRRAFKLYAESFSLAGLNLEGSPLDIWRRIQEEMERRSGRIVDRGTD